MGGGWWQEVWLPTMDSQARVWKKAALLLHFSPGAHLTAAQLGKMGPQATMCPGEKAAWVLSTASPSVVFWDPSPPHPHSPAGPLVCSIPLVQAPNCPEKPEAQDVTSSGLSSIPGSATFYLLLFLSVAQSQQPRTKSPSPAAGLYEAPLERSKRGCPTSPGTP